MLEEVAQCLDRYGLGSVPTRLAVAVSGGADSVTLLYLLHRLAEEFSLQLRVIHVNHQLRGAESAEDERWVRELADHLQTPIDVVQSPVAGTNDNLEQAARNARREVFHSLMAEGTADKVALGHTQSDQAETVLFRLLRGSSLAGLSGMRPLSGDGLLRPLLKITREEVREWAKRQRILWREDSSNNDLRFRRNWVRSELLPSIRASLNNGVERVLARTAELAQAEEDYWRDLIISQSAEFCFPTPIGLICRVSYLQQQPLAVQRRLVRHAFEKVKGSLRALDSSHVEAVLKICSSSHGHDRVLLPGLDALRSFHSLLLTIPGEINREKRHYRIKIVTNELIPLPLRAGFIRVDSQTEPCSERLNCVNVVNGAHLPEMAMLSQLSLGGQKALERLVIRNWEPGDQYQPAGHRDIKKVKQLFQENQILLWDRRQWPVLELDGEIVWVRRFGPSEKFRAEQDCLSAVSLIYIAPFESNVLYSASEKVIDNIPAGSIGQAGKAPVSER